MNIAKVSRYIPVITGTSGGREGTGGTVRSMLVSIPRVEFLEKDRDNTEFYHKYTSVEEIPIKANTSYSQEWLERTRTQPMSEREKIIEQLLNAGHTYKQIGSVLGLSKGAIPAYVHRIRAKRAYIIMQEENAKTDN